MQKKNLNKNALLIVCICFLLFVVEKCFFFLFLLFLNTKCIVYKYLKHDCNKFKIMLKIHFYAKYLPTTVLMLSGWDDTITPKTK